MTKYEEAVKSDDLSFFFLSLYKKGHLSVNQINLMKTFNSMFSLYKYEFKLLGILTLSVSDCWELEFANYAYN